MKTKLDVINLDLGCGKYPVCLYEPKPGAVYILFDLNPKSLKVAREKLKDKDIAVNYVQGLNEHLPFKDETISHIDMRASLLFGTESVLLSVVNEIGRILKWNGTVTISSYKNTLEELRKRFEKQHIYHEMVKGKMVTTFEKFRKTTHIYKIMGKEFRLGDPFLIWTFRKKWKK